MNKIFEASGKTVEEALDAVCVIAGVGLDEGEVEVISYGSKGILGIGGRPAKVRLIIAGDDIKEINKEEAIYQRQDVLEKPTKTFNSNQKKSEKPIKDVSFASDTKVAFEKKEPEVIDKEGLKQIEELAINFLTPIFNEMKVAPKIETEYKNHVLWFSLTGENLSSLIGRRGEVLNSLQYLTNLSVNRKIEKHIRIILDVENYREGRERTLHSLAKKMAEKAIRTGRKVELEPMNPHERRVVHMALQDDKRVDTLSRGDEPYRRVIIVKKNFKKKNYS